MESILSNRGLRAGEYALIVLAAALLLSVCLLTNLTVAPRYDARGTCPLGNYTGYAIPPRG
jgi:hypothetical protein